MVFSSVDAYLVKNYLKANCMKKIETVKVQFMMTEMLVCKFGESPSLPIIN